ncbi:MAG: hypothetical protein M3340_19835, partial [Actinomycetota bacterium]|nr:hypothetical protein [Actinomycetota bacterium]
VTTERGEGDGRTRLALEAVELLAARPGEPARNEGGGAQADTTLVTLRVSLAQAVYLTAAHSFAREIRLLARAPGEPRGARPPAVDSLLLQR